MEIIVKPDDFHGGYKYFLKIHNKLAAHYFSGEMRNKMTRTSGTDKK